MKKIAMIIAKEIFRDEELLVPKEIFEKGGLSVTVASSTLGECFGKLGAVVRPDCLYSDLDANDYDAIMFVGGAGAAEYFDNALAHCLADAFYKKGKITSAICAAPTILARAGILAGKKATAYPDYKEDIVAGGSEYINDEVVVDGCVVTGNGPDAAGAFGRKIVELLNDE